MGKKFIHFEPFHNCQRRIRPYPIQYRADFVHKWTIVISYKYKIIYNLFEFYQLFKISLQFVSHQIEYRIS